MSNIDKILMPFKIRALREDDSFAELTYEPLMRGFGHTIGNSLRRVLLSSIRGTRIVAIEGENLLHELSSIPGVLQDISEICLNLHGVRVYAPGESVYTLRLNISGARSVYASDIEEHSGIKILTPEVFLFEMDGSHDINIKILIESNVGICPREELAAYNKDLIGRIYLHEKYFFSPVLSVGLTVEEYTLGRNHNLFNRLRLSVRTDGSIRPIDAVSTAAHTLQHILSTFITGDIIYENQNISEEQPISLDPVLFTKIIDMKFSTRAENSLVNSGIRYLGDLLSKDPSKIQSRITNFGQKSFDEVSMRVEEMGLKWTGILQNWPTSCDEVEKLVSEYARKQKFNEDNSRRIK